MASGLMRPLYLAIIAMAALPGMRRGLTKFSVTAAHRVARKNPSLRTTNLIGFRASCRGSYPFGFRWRSMTPQSGCSYAAGFAYGFCWVTQPDRLFVLYWYQSTPSVTGMTGTSLTITASSCFTIECCSALEVVPPYWSISLSTAGFSYRAQFVVAFFPIGAEFFEYSSCRSS